MKVTLDRLPRNLPGDDDNKFMLKMRASMPVKDEPASGWGRGWKAGWSKATSATRTARRGFNPGACSNLKQQRVTVKASFHKMGGARGAVAFARYMEGEHQDRAQGFDRDQEVDGQDLAARWTAEHDARHFRFIVTPERDCGDMQSFTRELMQRVEHDLGTKLEWFAVEHNDGTRHAHIMVRGRDETGQHLHINGKYMAHGFRQHAQDIATSRLGERSREEIERGIERSRELKELREVGRQTVERAHELGAVNDKQAKELYREMKTAEPERVEKKTEHVREQIQERQREMQREAAQQAQQQRDQEWRERWDRRSHDRGHDMDMGY